MKKLNNQFPLVLRGFVLCLLTFTLASQDKLMAQDSLEAPPVVKPRAVTIFEAQYIVDNQTVTVPRKKVLNMAIQHRFGVVSNGRKDLYGIFGAANIRLGLSYSPINNLLVGIGVCKGNFLVDLNAKYSLTKQMDIGGWPVSISIFANMGIDSREKAGNFVQSNDRFSYFSQVLIARKITEKLSLQVAPSLSYFNNVPAYRDKNGDILPKMKNGNFGISFSGRYKLKEKFHIVANYDQPLTQNLSNNPLPNICFGIEMTTISHAFQVFLGNSGSIVPQYVNVYNQNDYLKGQFLIGFNITRRWNFN